MEITAIRDSNIIVSPVPLVSQELQKEQRVLIHAVRAVNAAASFGDDNELTFYFDRSTRKALVRIVNKETREVVRQIPSETVLRIAQELSA